MAYTDWGRFQRASASMDNTGILLQNTEQWGYTINTGNIRYGITTLHNPTSYSNNGSPAIIHTFTRSGYSNLSHDHQVDIEALIYSNGAPGPTNSGDGVHYGAFIGCWSFGAGGSSASRTPSLPAGFLACFERRALAGSINYMTDHILLRGWNTHRYPVLFSDTTSDGVLGITSAPSSAYHIIRLVATPISLSEKLLELYYGNSATPILSYIVEKTQPQWSQTGNIVFGYYFRATGIAWGSSTGLWHGGSFYDWKDEEARYPRLGFDYVNFNVTKYLSS